MVRNRESLFNNLTSEEKQKVIMAKMNFEPGKRIANNCQECGACCLAYSIKRLKGVGSPCPNLEIENGKISCRDYENRPETCVLYDCRDEKDNTKPQKERIRELFSAKVLNIKKLNESKTASDIVSFE